VRRNNDGRLESFFGRGRAHEYENRVLNGVTSSIAGGSGVFDGGGGGGVDGGGGSND
jgi:hypothetical protein